MLLRDGALKPWCGRISVGELALHTNNLLVLRGPKAVHKPLPGACLTCSECLRVLESRLDNILRQKREDCGVNCGGVEEKRLTDDVKLS